MTGQPPIYGLDLITNASGPLIDPVADRILEIGLSTPAEDELYEGGEPELIELLDRRLRLLEPGVLATWHGSVLAIPMIARRSARWQLSLGLSLWADRRSAPPSPIAGVDQASCASWHAHQVLDLRRVYETVEPKRRGLRRGRGVDPEDLIPPADDLADRDPRKDARLARQLAERRWSQARRFVDGPAPEGAGTDASVTSSTN